MDIGKSVLVIGARHYGYSGSTGLKVKPDTMYTWLKKMLQ